MQVKATNEKPEYVPVVITITLDRPIDWYALRTIASFDVSIPTLIKEDRHFVSEKHRPEMVRTVVQLLSMLQEAMGSHSEGPKL